MLAGSNTIRSLNCRCRIKIIRRPPLISLRLSVMTFEVIGKHYPKTDAAKMVQAKPCYVEDRVTADACVIKMLRSPHAHALITHLDVSKAEALGVVHVITHLNCRISTIPRVVRRTESSPLDRRMFGKKMRHVGDCVAAVVAESEEIALEALKLIDVEY
ncbi:hypothetical protein ACVXHB_10205 [Escherichia coli]